MPGTLDRWFDLRANTTNAGTEVRAGITTFMVMAIPSRWPPAWGSTPSWPSSWWPGAG